MRVYIAGPMTGKACYNAALFAAARKRWEEAGHNATTPIELNDGVWQRIHDRPFDPCTDRAEHGDPILANMIVEDVAAVLSADALVLLRGWEHSRGTRVELLIAANQGIPIYDAESGDRLTIEAPTVYRVTRNGDDNPLFPAG